MSDEIVQMQLKDLADRLPRLLGRDLMACGIERGELMILVRRESIVRVLKVLRDDEATRMNCLMDVCGVDYPESEERFEVVYQLLSLEKNLRLRVKLFVGEGESVPSVTGVYPSAGWFERETWDLFGITFSGHGDLRRILTDYTFEGHPLRKDFPLTGHVQMRYDAEQARCVYEPVMLEQDYRSFDFESPWEGMTDLMRAGMDKNARPLEGGKGDKA